MYYLPLTIRPHPQSEIHLRSWAGDIQPPLRASISPLLPLYSILLYTTLLNSTIFYSTLLYTVILYSTATLLYSILLPTLYYYTVLFTVLYCTIFYTTVLYSTVKYFTALYCMPVLFPTLLYSITVLYTVVSATATTWLNRLPADSVKLFIRSSVARAFISTVLYFNKLNILLYFSRIFEVVPCFNCWS